MKIAAWLLAAIPAAVLAEGLVGSTIPPYPDGFTQKQGACIARALRGIENECDFSIGILEDSSGVPKILFGARMVARDEFSRRPLWTLSDAVPYPTLPKGYLLAIATCQDNGSKDETIVAAVRATQTEWLADVLWARRYDFGTEKFVEHPSRSVRCLNEGWGL